MRKTFALMSLAAAAISHAQIFIDDFATGDFQIQRQSGSELQFQNGSMLGGERAVRGTVEANPFNQNLTIRVRSGRLTHSGGAGLDALTQLYYGFTNDGSGGLARDDLNLNASGQGLDRIRINWLRNDLDHRLRVTLESSGGRSSSVFRLIAGSQFNAFTTDLLFSEFSGNADLADIDQITFDFDPQAAGDFALEDIQAVPEPATLTAIGFGLWALSRRRRA
jgi:hypothetical protein